MVCKCIYFYILTKCFFVLNYTYFCCSMLVIRIPRYDSCPMCWVPKCDWWTDHDTADDTDNDTAVIQCCTKGLTCCNLSEIVSVRFIHPKEQYCGFIPNWISKTVFTMPTKLLHYLLILVFKLCNRRLYY